MITGDASAQSENPEISLCWVTSGWWGSRVSSLTLALWRLFVKIILQNETKQDKVLFNAQVIWLFAEGPTAMLTYTSPIDWWRLWDEGESHNTLSWCQTKTLKAVWCRGSTGPWKGYFWLTHSVPEWNTPLIVKNLQRVLAASKNGPLRKAPPNPDNTNVMLQL